MSRAWVFSPPVSYPSGVFSGTPGSPPPYVFQPLASTNIGVPTPVVTAVLPNSGPVAGGNTVTIHGYNLTTPTKVMFGSKAAPASPASPLMRSPRWPLRAPTVHGQRPADQLGRDLERQLECPVHLHQRSHRDRGEPVHRSSLGRDGR